MSCARSGWLIVFLLTLAVYLFTLAPDLTWQDQGDYQYQAAKCSLSRPGDAVRVHPLYIVAAHVVGRLGLWNYARAANIVNATFSAITVANVYLIVQMLCARRWPALLAAGVFALSHTAWFIATQAQTYGMVDAAVSGGLLLVLVHIKTGRTWPLLLMGLVFGLGMSVHIMTQIAFAVVVVWLIGRCIGTRVSVQTLAGIALCWIAGAVLFWVVAAIEYRRCGDISETIHSAIVGQWGSAVFNINRLGVLVKKSCMFFVLNFPTPLVLLAVPGVWMSLRRSGHRAIGRLLLICAVLYGAFAVRYDIPNQSNFFLPMYMFVSIYVGLGFAFLTRRNEIVWMTATGVLLLAMVPTYAGLSVLARANHLDLGTQRHVPYRDVYEYYLKPWQQNQTGPRRLIEDMFKTLPEGAIIYADTTTVSAILYAHEIEEQRPDIEVYTFSWKQRRLQHSAAGGARVFTLSDVKHYYPDWVNSAEWLKPFTISDSEHIFEIVIPSNAML